MLIETQATRWQRALTTNATAAFAAVVPTKTRPERSDTRAVWDFGLGCNRSSIVFCLFGTADNDDVVDAKVVGWNYEPTGLGLYVPTIVCQVRGNLSSSLPGVAGTGVLATELFCDVATLSTGIATVFQGTANIDIGRYIADVSGFELVEVKFAPSTGATDANGLVRFM